MQLNRDVLPDPAVGSFLIVVPKPILHLRSGIVKAHEPMRVQAFAAELAVERLDEGIVCRLSGSREVEGDTVRVGPEIEIAGDELAALVDANGLGVTDLSADPFQSPHDVFGTIAEPGINNRRELREDVDHGENPDLLAHRQLIMHEVHGPGLVRLHGRAAIFPELSLHPSFGRFVAQLQA